MSDIPPLYAVNEPGSDLVQLYYTNGSDDPGDWTEAGFGYLPDGTDWDDFEQDFENGEGDLDDLTWYDDYDEDAAYDGDYDSPTGDSDLGNDGGEIGADLGDPYDEDAFDDGDAPWDDNWGDGDDAVGDEDWNDGDGGYGDGSDSGFGGPEENLAEVAQGYIEAAESARENQAQAEERADQLDGAGDALENYIDSFSGDMPDMPDGSLLGDGNGAGAGGAGEEADNGRRGAEPVGLFSGRYMRHEIDFATPALGGVFTIERFYDNQRYTIGLLGPKWRIDFEDNLRQLSSGRVLRTTSDGKAVVYYPSGNDYVSPTGCPDILESASTGWRVRDGFGLVRSFDMAGKLTRIEDRFGNAISYVRNNIGRVTEIRDSSGRAYALTYADDRLTAISDPVGRTVEYDYIDGNLAAVRLPAPSVNQAGPLFYYDYTDTSDVRMSHNLIAVRDATGHVLLQNEYGDSGLEYNRILSQTVGGATIYFQYLQTNDPDNYRRTRVISRRQLVVDYTFDINGRLKRTNRFTTGLMAGAPNIYLTQFEYTDHGLVRRVIDAGGRVTEFVYDEDNPDPLARLNLLELRRLSPPHPGPIFTRTRQFSYGIFNQLVQIRDETGAVTDITLNAGGLPTEVRLPQVPVAGGGNARPVIIYDYNSSGLPLREIDPGGLETLYEYYTTGSRQGLLRRIRSDPDGVDVLESYQLDNLGRVLSHTLPTGVRFDYTYDERDRPTELQIGGEVQRTWTYDRYDRNIEIWDRRIEPDGTPSGEEWICTYQNFDHYGRLVETRREASGIILEQLRYLFDADENLISIAGPGTSEVLLQYEERGLPVSITHAPGTSAESVTRFLYDASGRVVERVSARGHRQTLSYNGFDQPTEIIDPLGNKDEMRYDSLGRLLAISRYDASGIRRSHVEITYDALGRSLRRRVAHLRDNGSASSWLVEETAYDVAGNPVQQIAPSGRVTSSQYDDFGREIRRDDPEGNVQEMFYDDTANSLAITQTGSRADGGSFRVSHTITWDNFGRPQQTRDSAGRVETLVYDNQGNLRQHNRRDGTILEHDYDPLSRPIATRIIDPTAAAQWEQRTAYTEAGLPAWVEDAEGKRITFTYDARGHVIRIDGDDGLPVLLFDYNSSGEVVRQEDGRGVVLQHTFDPLGRVIERMILGAPIGPTHESFTYDALGNIVTAVNDFANVAQSYDSRSLLRTATMHGQTVERSYRSTGAPYQLTYPSGLKLTYTQDSLRRTTRLSGSLVAGHDWTGATSLGLLAELNYDGRDLLQSIITGNGVESAWQRDVVARPITLHRRHGTTLLHHELALHDSLDRRITWCQKGTGALSYSFDGRGQLIAAEPVDEPGNIDTLVAPILATDQLPPPTTQSDIQALTPSINAGATTTFEYDLAGNREQMSDGTGVVAYNINNLNQPIAANGQPVLWDGAGNLIDDGSFEYAYDYAGRLCRATEKATSSVIYEARYDALGRRIEYNQDGVTHRIVFDGYRAIEERSPADDMLRAIVWGPLPSQPIMVSLAGDNYFVHADLQGNISEVTNQNGEIVERYTYGLFGQRTIIDPVGASVVSSSINNDMGFIGRPHIEKLPVIDHRSRQLHSALGRFASADASGFVSGLNLYLYAGNDPVSQADYNGQSATVVGGAIGLAWGGGWAVGSMINAGIYEATGGEWGEEWKGLGHYGSQVAQFTVSGAMIGAAVDLAPVGGGALSAALIGAGASGAIAAFDGGWGNFGTSVGIGGALGLGLWGVGRAVAPVLGPAAAWLGGTAIGQGVIGGLGRLAGTGLGARTIGAFTGARNWLAGQAENTWGNALVSRISGPAIRDNLQAALAGHPTMAVSQADLAAMNAIHRETMATLNTNATTWGGFQTAYWKAARNTQAFQQFFPNATGTGAPVYGNLGRLNLHHLAGRIRDLYFAESNLVLVPNALDTPFVHSAAYLTGTQQWAIRRGLRQLFPRQWTPGSFAAGLAQYVFDSQEYVLGEGGDGPLC